MQQTDLLTTLFRHNLWANLRLFEFCTGLTAEQMNATIPGAFGSIADTLHHVVRSEESYFERISTGKRRPKNPNEPRLTMPEMIESLQTTGRGFIEWAPKILPEDTVVVDWEGTPRDVPKTILFSQALQHGAEHREQIKAILTEIGIEPPDLQGWQYFDELYSAGA
jgi:uncharacterized damage-inducible protein DinB